MLDHLEDAANSALFRRLPADQLERVLGSDMCDIDQSFLGFIGIYTRLADIVPHEWTVVDLGCAYAPQAFLFDQHRKYIGVDLMTPVSSRFSAGNTIHHEMSIGTFIKSHVAELNKEMCFAICSYVPPGGGEDTRGLAREAFENVFTYYPRSERHVPVLTGVQI